MKPTRRTQPQRKVVGRAKTGGLKASMRGMTAMRTNPADWQQGRRVGGPPAPRAQGGPAPTPMPRRLPDRAIGKKLPAKKVGTKFVSVQDNRHSGPGFTRGGATVKPGGLKGKLRQGTRALNPASTPSKRPEVVRTGSNKKAAEILRDGSAPRVYAPGTQTNTSGNERDGEKFRTFTVGGQKFNEYRRNGKTVIVAGGAKPKPDPAEEQTREAQQQAKARQRQAQQQAQARAKKQRGRQTPARTRRRRRGRLAGKLVGANAQRPTRGNPTRRLY